VKYAAGWMVAVLCACSLTLIFLSAPGQGNASRIAAQGPAATPIKHLIVIVGENRSFDHVFGLYQPRHGQRIWNLLSRRIVNADGTPGPNFTRAAQFQVPAQSAYYISPPSKIRYPTLPPPFVDDAPGFQRELWPPFKNLNAVMTVEPALATSDGWMLTTGATGLSKGQTVDTRVRKYDDLPDGPYQLTGPNLPYDSYTGDTVHRFFQMWQQSDCSAAARGGFAGCANDLYPFIALSYSRWNYGGSNAMAFYNVNTGDAPLLKKLADGFNSSDNFHQSFMGGTGGNHMMLGTGDAIFFTHAKGYPAQPPISQIANPNPQPGSENRYINDGRWTDCAGLAAPGVAPISDYLRALQLRSGCEPGHYYMVNNTEPGFLPNGTLRNGAPGSFVPPSNLRTIGDALSQKGVSWAYYGGAFDAAVRQANGSSKPADRAGRAYCQICNPFQYVSSIMTNLAARKEHLKDVVDLFHDLGNDSLPSVCFVKPDGMLDGHPASSKLDLFEALVKNILERLDADPALAHETAVFITFDEAGGYYDSGYIQSLDFFGDGPRIPFIVVSDFSKGGHIIHTYYDHVSILKFIERNWRLKPLTTRSRDNLPNPVASSSDPYVPRNRPAIGDLFEMFNFKRASER
jgi:phospholipase C